MTAHLSERQVPFEETGQKSTGEVTLVAPVSASLPAPAPGAPIARVGGGKFAPGRSANPGGLPKGLRTAVQREAGKDGKKLVKGLWLLALGTPHQRQEFFGEAVRVSRRTA